ncbi:MAG: KdsC family phosphatase [Crocinitomicaceae bacterium]
MTFYNKNLSFLLEENELKLSEFQKKVNILEQDILEPSIIHLIDIANYFKISIDSLLKKDIQASHISDIQFLILDVDGTLTDGGMYFTENGDLMKKYNTKDGMAIKGLTKAGFQVGIISHSHQSKMVESRATMLGIQNVFVGSGSKLDILDGWLKNLNMTREQVAYVGDDINDAEIMKVVGLSACPKDATKSIQEIADVILEQDGGKACVREFIDEHLTITI